MSDKLLDHLGQIDDDIIAEADVIPAASQPARRPWRKWAPFAAAVAACLIIAIPWLHYREQPLDQLLAPGVPELATALDADASLAEEQPADADHATPQLADAPDPTGPPAEAPDLPQLAVNTEFGSFGFEGYLAYDISELRNGNPWVEASIATAPLKTSAPQASPVAPNEEADRAPASAVAPESAIAPESAVAPESAAAPLYVNDELPAGNPWTEASSLTTLPVFKNPTEYDQTGAPLKSLSEKEMRAKAADIAKAMDLELISLRVAPTPEQIEAIRQKLQGAPEEEIRRNITASLAIAQCKDALIEVQSDGQIILTLTSKTADLVKNVGKLRVNGSFTVSFFGYEDATSGSASSFRGLPLPDGYRLSYHATSYEQALRTTEYLFAEYGAFTGITTPGYNLSADYTYSGELTLHRTAVFENKGSLTERILNYNFNNLYFLPTETGELGGIRYEQTDLSQKIGDYPIITPAEARTLLLEKRYITTVPEELPGATYIAQAELIYRTTQRDPVYLPYYKFLVEMPSLQMENNLKTFGAFYVPAVKAEYLENLPLWDGSFN